VASATANALAALLLRSAMLAGRGIRKHRADLTLPADSALPILPSSAFLTELARSWVVSGGPDGEQFSCLADLIQTDLVEASDGAGDGTDRLEPGAVPALLDLAVHLDRIGSAGAARACTDAAVELTPVIAARARTRLLAIGRPRPA
jgi:hypothetical protein